MRRILLLGALALWFYSCNNGGSGSSATGDSARDHSTNITTNNAVGDTGRGGTNLNNSGGGNNLNSGGTTNTNTGTDTTNRGTNRSGGSNNGGGSSNQQQQ